MKHLKTLCVVLCTLYLAPAARAQNAQPTSPQDRIKALNAEATAAFESYSFRKARRRLDQALDLAQASGLKADAVVAETHLLLGVATIAGSNDLYRGLHHFVRALRINPRAEIPKNLATPQLLQMFATANKTVKSVGKPPTISVRKPPSRKTDSTPSAAKAGGRGLLHTPIDSAKRGYPIPVKATAGLDIQAHRLFLHFRPAGTVKFLRLPMKQTRGVFRASIPATATRGRYVHYYIQAVDKRGRLAGSKGSPRSPNITIIR